jgi:hypothetical protein
MFILTAPKALVKGSEHFISTIRSLISLLEIIQCVFLIHEILELHFFGMSNETSSATATGSELDFDPLLDLHLERADSAQSV